MTPTGSERALTAQPGPDRLTSVPGWRRRWGEVLVVALLTTLATTIVVANRHQPIVGNALVYARMTYDFLDRGAGECRRSEVNKACGYAFVSMPFVKWLGANRGLKVSSVLLAVLALLAAVPFFRAMNRSLGVPPEWLWLELLVLMLNPLVLYQLLAAYVDAPFLGAALLSFVALERLLARERPTVADALWYFLALMLALWLKHQALSLPILHLAWALARPGRLRRLFGEHRRVAWLTVAGLLLFGGLLALGRQGWLPLYNLSAEKSQYAGVFALAGLGEPFRRLLFFLAITAHVLVVLPLVRPARAMLAPLVVMIVYVAMIVFNAGARGNPRWYLPLLPFLALLVAHAAARLPRRLVAGLAVGFVLVNVPLTLGYNLESAYAWLAARGIGLPIHPNLGVTSEMRSHRLAIARVERERPPLPVYAHMRYYYGGARGVLGRGGFFSPGVEVRDLFDERDVRHDRFWVLNLLAESVPGTLQRLLLCDGPVPGGGFWCMGEPRAAGEKLVPTRFRPYSVPCRKGDPCFDHPPPELTAPPKAWQILGR